MQVRWRDDPDALQRWKDGRTGMPLVDANMREMAQTGALWTSPSLRVRREENHRDYQETAHL